MSFITNDEELVQETAARFDLRRPNKNALAAIVETLSTTDGEGDQLVADLATGVGKTFLMAALVDYLAHQGVRNVLVVTPGSTIQRKTLENFDEASPKYVGGAEYQPVVITPENFRSGRVATALSNSQQLKVFVFNVQQLIRPTDKVSRRIRNQDENLGAGLYDYLAQAEDLVVIADEHHVYHENATQFNRGVKDLSPRSLVGLTATPHSADRDKVIFRYTLAEAIADGYVKTPVIVYRRDGNKHEDTQLADAVGLLKHKEEAYAAYVQHTGVEPVRPVLFAVAKDTTHAREISERLAQPDLIGPEHGAVLEVTSKSSDEALEALTSVERLESPVRAVVAVNMLKEGWDVKNIAVIVARRRLASLSLTPQILGRGLRLPFGKKTGYAHVDQVDLVAHDSFQQILAQKDVLLERLEASSEQDGLEDDGAAVPSDREQQILDQEQVSGHTIQQGPEGHNQTQWWTPEGTDGADELADQERESTPVMGLSDQTSRLTYRPPEPKPRRADAPDIKFPRQSITTEPRAFHLAEVSLKAARNLGSRFTNDSRPRLAREVLEAHRDDDDDVEIQRTLGEAAEATQVTVEMDHVAANLVQTVRNFREIPKEKKQKAAAEQLVAAFLEGASTSSAKASRQWGEARLNAAANTLQELVRGEIRRKKSEPVAELYPIALAPVSVTVDPQGLRRYPGDYVKKAWFEGWKRSIMPVQQFDAETTEWELAKLLDESDGVRWWQRIYTNEDVCIETAHGPYYPDFVVVDTDGVHWIVEGKSNKNAEDADVLRKKESAERWTREVNAEGDYGQWRYIFATEQQINAAGGDWQTLLTLTAPE